MKYWLMKSEPDEFSFQDLAESNPDLVCGLHRGMVEGFVDEIGDCRVHEFRTLVDRNACQVDLVDT